MDFSAILQGDSPLIHLRNAMTGAVTHRRRQIGLERRQRTRQRLLEAAARVVAHLGEDQATIDHFINEAGVARGTFYNHFPTRGDLVKALWKHVGQDPFRAIQSASASVTDPAERLVLEARLVVAKAGQDSTWGWLVWYLSRSSATLNEDLRAYPLPDLVAGRAAGRFRFDDNNAARDLVVSAVRAAMRNALTSEPPEEYFQSLSAMLLVALGITLTEARRLARLPLPRVDGLVEVSARKAPEPHSSVKRTSRTSRIVRSQ